MPTDPLTDAIAAAEKIIEAAPHILTEQDLVEGYEYLAGSIRASIQMAWAYDPRFPFFASSTGPYTKMGLDNPDTLYFHANIDADHEYVVAGRRGTTTDLSFQILAGDYSPVDVPDSLTAFDDRSIDIASDGTFELHFGRPSEQANHFTLGEGSSMLVVREVYNDWSAARGTLTIRRVGEEREEPNRPTKNDVAKRYATAGKMLLGRLNTFLQFPHWFYLKLEVNTLTEPRLTPGGLSTQYSSAGHYQLQADQAMIVTVPKSDAPYQGFQLGSMWYVSLDYIHHQTSLTSDQAQTDPDGMMRLVVSEQNPHVANWIETTGHARGYAQIRWQRVSRELTSADGPTVEVVDIDDVPSRLPYYEQNTITPEDFARRIAARRRGVDERMLG
ncbi:hypothetical protein C5142_22085 [Rhodococcus sp. BGS-1C]|uniref:hypothetical protein n=1 Tax=unclassified Rhodococcus (in: high G+C Gram-positive bacteria) TaxID=192944 RepID=UPI000964FFAE|nr:MULTISPECIES: hypothetical protein [unclassified Rhodococcus (in: high G+C Gram-positive bacteria)]MCC8929846.1 hypothetical protein [Rhodococcus sp. I2R]OLT37242.1 hypothetical protein BJF84_06945 [Rhodococcus sp. CUA-806]